MLVVGPLQVLVPARATCLVLAASASSVVVTFLVTATPASRGGADATEAAAPCVSLRRCREQEWASSGLLGTSRNMNPTPLVPGSRVLDRRQWLGGASLLGISTLLPKSFLSKSFLSSSLPAPNPTTLWTPPKNFTSGPACTLTLAQTEGPYYVNPALLRQDITEGRSGFPLQLSITVVRASTCAPIQNAIVDIWHCDENGLYSGFSGQLGGLDTQGDNFYRGIQVTDANGVATFRTIYPGYYPGRTVHIHFKVWQNGTQSLTSQLYFDDKLTDEIFAAAEPYNGRAARTTRNTNDGIYNAALVVAATPHQGGVASAFTVVVA